MFKPRRIHKDKPIAAKLNYLDPNSILGQWDWELRKDFYYPVPKASDTPPKVLEEIARKQSLVVASKKGSLIKLAFIVFPFLVLALGLWLR
jgi:hypothetical protein